METCYTKKRFAQQQTNISNVMTQQQEQFKAYTPRRELFALLSDKLPF